MRGTPALLQSQQDERCGRHNHAKDRKCPGRKLDLFTSGVRNLSNKGLTNDLEFQRAQ